MSSKGPISPSSSGSPERTSAPEVRVSWSMLGGRRVELIPSPPSDSSGDDLSITVACKVYSFGIHTLLEGFWRKESSYVPMVVKLEGKEGPTTIYVKVDSAAKRLLSSKQEVRENIQHNPYWNGRVAVIKSSIKTIRESKRGDSNQQDVYDKLVTVYSRGLKALEGGALTEGETESYEEYTVSQEKGELVIKCDVGHLGKGGFGTVAKVLYVASGGFAALKKITKGKAKPANPVAQAVMEKQKQNPDKESHLLKVNAITKRGDFFDEEYELATGDISKEYQLYEEGQLKDLGLSTIQALEELEEIGYVHLDIKPKNILNVTSAQYSLFKLGDYDEGSPHIESEGAFKEWLESKKGAAHTANYNTEADWGDLGALEMLAFEIQGDAYTALAVCRRLLKDKYPEDCPMGAFLLEIQTLLQSKEPGSLDEAFSKVFTTYKQKAREISVFQLGVMLYKGVVGERPYLPAEDKYCEATPENFAEMQKKLFAASKGSPAFKALIARMLDPDSAKRPTYQEIKKGMQEQPSRSLSTDLKVEASERPSGLSTIPEGVESEGFSLDGLSEIHYSISSNDSSKTTDPIVGIFEGASPSISGSPALSHIEEDPAILARVQGDMKHLASGKELKKLMDKTDRVFQAAKQNTLAPARAMLVGSEEGFIHRVKSGKVQVSVIVGTLGEGSFGYVYKFYDLFTGSIRALKVLEKASDEMQVAEEMMAYEIEHGSIPYVQRFLEAPHIITDSSGSEEEVEWVVSEAYECNAYEKMEERKKSPVALPTLLREFYCIAAGFNNVLKVLGRIHLDLKLRNFLFVRDGEMVVGDLGDLPKVKNAEQWVSSIRSGSLQHIHTKKHTVQSDIQQLRDIRDRVQAVMYRNESVIREIKSLADKITFAEEEMLALESGEILESVNVKVKKYHQDKYDKDKEELSKLIYGNNPGLYVVIQGVENDLGLTAEEKAELVQKRVSDSVKDKFFHYQLQEPEKTFQNDIASFMRQDLRAIEEIRKLGDVITLGEEEREALERGILPESVERKFEAHMFNEYKKYGEKAAVFQLGSSFYEMLFDGDLPYSLATNGYQVPTQAEFEVIARRLQQRMPENPELAALIADMLSPEIDVDPSKIRERPSPESIEAALKSYLDKEGARL